MPPPTVSAITTSTSDVPLTIAAVGNGEAISSVDVKSRVTGQVLRVAFTDGQDVEKGQLLFEIDPEPLQRQLAEIQAELTKDTALEAQARANAARDEALLKQSRSAADRGIALAKEGIYSKEQTEQVIATAESSSASLDADRAAIESAAASLKADRARLAQTELQLTYTKILAPISGRAGAVMVKAGNVVRENDTTLVSLLQVSPIYVTFGVPEQLLAEIRRVQSTQPLKVEALLEGGKTAVGKLVFIDNTVDNTTGTIRLKAQFTNTAHTLWPGQFVNVRAQLLVEHGRIVVPSRTVQTGPQGRYVWVLNPENQTVSMRPVQVLRTFQTGKAAESAVIGSGLQAGEKVISEGQMRLAPGMKVQPKPASVPGDAGSSTTAGTPS
jgi:membrane fusion protein, multidrug efflux system